MTNPVRLKPLVAVVAVLILAIAGVAAQERQQPAPDRASKGARTALPPAADAAVADLPENRAIARQQLALIDEAWDSLLSLAKTGRVEIGSGLFGQWGRRRLEAFHRAGAGKAEIVAALEKYIKDLKEMEAVAKALKDAARATQLGVHEMQFLRMEAQIWLNEEKAR